MPEETATPSSSSESETGSQAVGSAPGSVPGSALLRQGEKLADVGDSKATAASAYRFSEGSLLAGLPMQLDVTVPVPRFRVQDLLALEKGAILESRWPHTEDVPVWCGGAQLAWTEFEVVEQKIAVRVTRLA